MSGLIHIYSGDGKGKTTAAAGLAIRAAGAGKKVVFSQFLKDGCSSEIKILKDIKNINVCVCCKPRGFVINMTDIERQEAKCDFEGLFDKALSLAENGADLLIFDEIISSCNLDIVCEKKLVEFLKNKPEKLEVVLTGRDPSSALVEMADYVTEMKKIKHPFDNGVNAREGIEY